jgi:hypothetical protein
MKRPMDFSHIPVPDDAMAAIMRRKTPMECIQGASNCRRMLCLLVHSQHPDWDEGRVSRSVFRCARSGEFPLWLEDILIFCAKKAGREQTARWAEELGFKEIWDLEFVQKRLATNNQTVLGKE